MMYSNLVQALLICILLREYRMENLEMDICNEYCNCPLKEDRPSVICQDLNDIRLQALNKELSGKELKSLLIRGSKLGNTTKGALSNIKAEEIHFYEVDMYSLEFFAAFHGTEDTLKRLEIELTKTEKKWTFSSGEGFHKLEYFRLTAFRSFSADPIIQSLPRNLKEIHIYFTDIASLENSSFALFSNLKNLNLNWNKLNSLERRFLPHPATHLETLSLLGNPITSLPNDMFEEMPALSEINLVKTKLSILPYRTFEPVFKQLNIFEFGDIDLVCDCDDAWLLKRIMLWNTSDTPVKCNEPDSLKGTKLSTLLPIDMCYNCAEYYKNKEV